MKKSELRKSFLANRMRLDGFELKVGSKNIAENFVSEFYPPDNSLIHHYIPIEKMNEIDCGIILKKLSNKRFAVPRVNPSSEALESIEIEPDTRFVTNKWGICEPASGRLIDETEIDLVIVPLLCFDKRGHRVGYGKGYYDSFLSKCRTDCLKIGLSFFAPIENIEDIHDNDVPLDYCCTPKEVFEFRETR